MSRRPGPESEEEAMLGPVERPEQPRFSSRRGLGWLNPAHLGQRALATSCSGTRLTIAPGFQDRTGPVDVGAESADTSAQSFGRPSPPHRNGQPRGPDPAPTAPGPLTLLAARLVGEAHRQPTVADSRGGSEVATRGWRWTIPSPSTTARGRHLMAVASIARSARAGTIFPDHAPSTADHHPPFRPGLPESRGQGAGAAQGIPMPRPSRSRPVE